MEAFFLRLVNMSINAGWVVLAVLVARLLLRKAPKYVHCLLWGLVAVRLLYPCPMESAVSLIPSAKTIDPQILLSGTPAIHSGIKIVDQLVNSILADGNVFSAAESGRTLQHFVTEASNVWFVGMLLLLLYSRLASVWLSIKVRASVCYNMFNDIDEIRVCDGIESPFILGVLEPVIYLPSDLSKETQNFVIAHERAHLKRHDNLWKPLGFLLLSIYWFHPLMWIAYILLCRDIEMACDERAVRLMNGRERKGYSGTLLSCSVPRHMIAACPLAFGSTGVKQRVKNVLNYKKPAFWVRLVASMVLIFMTACFLTNPKEGPTVANNMWAKKAAGDHYAVQSIELWK